VCTLLVVAMVMLLLLLLLSSVDPCEQTADRRTLDG